MFVFLNCAKSKDKKERIEHEHPMSLPRQCVPLPASSSQQTAVVVLVVVLLVKSRK